MGSKQVVFFIELGLGFGLKVNSSVLRIARGLELQVGLGMDFGQKTVARPNQFVGLSAANGAVYGLKCLFGLLEFFIHALGGISGVVHPGISRRSHKIEQRQAFFGAHFLFNGRKQHHLAYGTLA